MRFHGVKAYPQHDRAFCLERGELIAKGARLLGATRGVVAGIKVENKVATGEISQRNTAAAAGDCGEVRRAIAFPKLERGNMSHKTLNCGPLNRAIFATPGFAGKETPRLPPNSDRAPSPPRVVYVESGFHPAPRVGSPGSPMPVRRGEREGVWQVADFVHGTIRQKHLHDVETDFDARLFEAAKVVERRL